MFEFIKKDDMIYSVKGFWEVKKNTYGKFTSVKGRVSASAVEWLVTTEDVEINQILHKMIVKLGSTEIGR